MPTGFLFLNTCKIPYAYAQDKKVYYYTLHERMCTHTHTHLRTYSLSLPLSLSLPPPLSVSTHLENLID